MYRRYLNARSPVRLLERSLHGGLGEGNLGLVVAAAGVGKTSFLVGVALDALLRGERVLHVSLDQSVAHVRAHYDTLFEELAARVQLERSAQIHAELDRLRRIRVYPPGAFGAKQLHDALRVESETGAPPRLVVLDGCELPALEGAELEAMREAAQGHALEIWIAARPAEPAGVPEPARLERLAPHFAAILLLEPGDGEIRLRRLASPSAPEAGSIDVVLDPKTLLLVRS